ncbi:MAG: hypothetical protein WBB27_18975, partial [Maribacter sp.]
NAMFYVGDTRQSNYENFDGGIEQKNPSNFIELTAASSIVEFMAYESNAGTVDDLAQPSKFFEYGITSDTGTLHLKHLRNDKNIKRFLCFHYYNIYVSNFMVLALKNDKLAWRNELKLENNYEKQRFYGDMASFTSRYYYRWLYELSADRHDRKFLPFDLSIIRNKIDLDKDISGAQLAKVIVDEKKLFTLVTAIPAKDSSNFFIKDRINYDEEFSKITKDLISNQYSNKERMISELLNQGISKIIDKRFSL